MVAGLDRFRKHFSGHEDHYALIGGAASLKEFTCLTNGS